MFKKQELINNRLDLKFKLKQQKSQWRELREGKNTLSTP